MLCSIQNEPLHGLDLAGDDGGAGFDTVQHDFARLVRKINPVIRSHRRAGAVRHLERHTSQRLVGGALDVLVDDEGGPRLVVEGQAVGHARAHYDVLRGLVKDVPGGCAALGHDDSGIGSQPGHSGGAVRARGVAAIVGADGLALAVPDVKFRVGQGLPGHGVPLQNSEGTQGIIVKSERLRIASIHHHGLRGGVCPVVVRGLVLRNDIGAGEELGEDDLPVQVGGVETVGAGHPLVVGGQLAAGAHDFEPCAGQRLLGHGIIFFHDQSALLRVGDDDGLRIAARTDHHVDGGPVDDVSAVRGLDLIQNVRAGGQVGDADLALTVSGENAVGGQGSRTNHTVQAHLAARRRGDAELRSRQNFAGLAVPLLNDQLTLRLIFECEGNSTAFLDLDGLALGVHDEPSGGFHLGDDDALARGETVDAHLAVLVTSENAVAIPDQGAVRISDLKLGILQGNRGIRSANLTNQQTAIRGTFIRNHAKPLENTHFI